MQLSDQFGSMVRNLLLLGSLLLCSVFISARVVTVGCTGASGGPFNFTTLADALADPNVSDIIVSGTCAETSGAWITGRQLNISGTAGASITSPGVTLGTKSPLLRLKDLIFVNYMIFVPEGNVEVDNCTIRHAGNGVEIWKQAQVSVTSSTIEDNDIGLSVRLGGHLLLGGSNTIRNNRIGVSDEGGSVWIADINDLNGNQTGLRLFNGGRAEISGGVTFADNQFGIALTNSSMVTGQQNGGAPLFRNNGISGDPASAAIVAEGNSHVDLFNSQVMNNRSHGLLIRDNSTIRITNDTISGNAGNGIRLLTLSSAHIYTGVTIMGNGGGDLVCSLNSFADGYKTGIGKMVCLTFTPSTEVQLW